MTDDFEIDDFFKRHLDAMYAESLLETLRSIDEAHMTLLGGAISGPPRIIDSLFPLRDRFVLTTEVSASDLIRRFKRQVRGVHLLHK